MVSVVACLLLGLVLVAAAGLKLAGGAAARAALATYGLAGRAAYAAWAALIAAELALGMAVAAGLDWAARALVPVLPRREPSTDGWLAIGLVLALAGIVALAVVVLALAREVGMLRLAVPQAGALEVAHEGPEVGARLTSVFDAPLAPGRL